MDADRKYRILFLCTGNACRSQMSEAILRHLDPVRFDALSAGSHPAGFVHPLVHEVMGRMKIPVIDQRSKSWDEFRDQPIDLLVTVCDSAANEVCPVWPGRPATLHWPLPDPTQNHQDPQSMIDAGMRLAERIRLRLERLVAMDWDRQPAETLLPELNKLADL